MAFRSDLFDGLTRQSVPFLFASRAIRPVPDFTRARNDKFFLRVLHAIARAAPVFLTRDHTRGVAIVDLKRADLDMYNLAGKNLSGFRFSRADLVRAHLEAVDLTNASLYRANLEGADLRHAVLRRADLRGANLGAAELLGADLTGALLTGASLRWADLRSARLAGCDLSGADLRDARFDADLDRSSLHCDGATQWSNGFETASP